MVEEEELRRAEERDALLLKVEAPFEEAKRKERLWNDWSAKWAVTLGYEAALRASVEALATSLLREEDNEVRAREDVEGEWMVQWQTIQREERRAFRVATEWLSVWLETLDESWDAERQRHEEYRREWLWRFTEGKRLDEEEIERLKKNLRSCMENIQRGGLVQPHLPAAPDEARQSPAENAVRTAL
jgi:hypothetical protein